MEFFIKRNLIIIASVAIFVIGGAFLLKIYMARRTDVVLPEFDRIHYFNNTGISLSNIDIKVIYLVPRDRVGQEWDNWRVNAADAFKTIARFHSIQFLGRSALHYELYPQPVVLPNSGAVYDASETLAVNTPALTLLESALKAPGISVTAPGLHDFISVPPGHYPLLFFVYEGAGTAGDKGRALVSTSVLRDKIFSENKETIMERNIVKALGYPGSATDAVPTSEGIMGAGSLRPLQINFIEPGILRGMGLFE